MNSYLSLCFLALSSLVCFTRAREFTDDRGVVFSWPDDETTPPTVVANANGAIDLFNLGMTNEQILGVWDKWIVRGSDIDIDSDDLSSHFDADPNKAELDFLKSVTDLSPECSNAVNGCARQFDIDGFAGLSPNFTVYVHHGPFSEITGQVEALTGSSPIFIDILFEDNDGCRTDANFDSTLSNCYSRSVIDVIARVRELAEFLGVPETEKVVQDQQKMCEAANEFSLMAEQLHERGVRCAAASVRTNNGGTVNVFNYNNLPWLRTFEELGLPLLHAHFDQKTDFTKTYTVSDWYAACGGDTSGCDDLTPLMPVDCFLFDSRTFAFIEESTEEVLAILPEETVRQEQYSYFLFNDAALSYRTVAAVLNQVRDDLKDTKLLYSQTPCTQVNVTSRDHTSLALGGLSGGQYACFDRSGLESEMLTCPEGFTPEASSVSTSESSSSSTSAETSAPSSIASGPEVLSNGSNADGVVQIKMKQALIILFTGIASFMFTS